MNDTRSNLFVGLLTVGLIAAGLNYYVRGFLHDPQVIVRLHEISPWLAGYATPISWIATAILFVGALVLPPILINSVDGNGNSKLALLGMFVSLACVVPAIGFLLGIGWLGFKTAVGT